MGSVVNEQGHVKKSNNPSPFLMKTYMVVEDRTCDEVISWNKEGTGFVVWQPTEFARDLLPTLFKHSNFSSFVRQLNTYGFRKVATNRWEFCNEKFKRGKRELLHQISRRKTWSAKSSATRVQIAKQEDEEDKKSSSTSSWSDYSVLVDENKRLLEENSMLNSEITRVKRKCKELLEVVAKYAHLEKEKEDMMPKLFGVRLEVEGEREKKRKRIEISESLRNLLSQSCK